MYPEKAAELNTTLEATLKAEVVRDRHNMLLIFPIILCSNSRRYHLLCFAFLPIMLESMIDINVKKRLETISQCHRLLYCSITEAST